MSEQTRAKQHRLKNSLPACSDCNAACRVVERSFESAGLWPRFRVVLALLLTTCLLGLTTACWFPGLGGASAKKGIVIAGGSTTERQILAEMMGQMVNHYLPEEDVSYINNLGSTTLIHQAIMRGDVNVAAMYTGTSLTGELGLEPIADPALAMATVQKGYRERFQRKWYDSFGFANTYAFMVKRSFAEEHNLKTVSDLGPLAPQLRAGVDTSWMEREGDGYEAFVNLYGINFHRLFPMEVGLVYNALENGEMDVALGYTTDGRINTYDLVVLEDDLHLFPAYDCSPVATEAVLAHCPELDAVLETLVGAVNTETMQALNKKGDEDQIEPRFVATEFLEEHHYFVDRMKGGKLK